MLHFLLRKLNFWRLLHEESTLKNAPKEQVLRKNLKKNLSILKEILGESNDIIFREFVMGGKNKIPAAIIYLDGLVDKTTVNKSILEPLMYDSRLIDPEITSISGLQQNLVSVGDVKEDYRIDTLVDACLNGDTCLLVDGFNRSVIISTREWESRGVQEPPTESVVRGPREGFTETLRTNTSLLRRKIHNPNLTFETMRLGTRTRTTVCIVYIKNLVYPGLVEEIRHRLKSIDVDSILESGYIEEFIEDAPFSPFATIGNSEKPDVVAGKMLEGRAAILVEGTPMVLTVPALFIEGFQSPEDYYSRPYYASLVRSLRFIAFAISILGPAVYVALTTFHQELIPTSLLITMVAAREGTPFPALVEAIGMGIIFEILREGGVRLPKPVGQAISIVGALVLGDAAVSAGLIGAPMVIVVALTAIASFVVPPHADSGSLMRISLTLAAGFLGTFGVVIGLLGFLVHVASLRSFGVPYFSPLAPVTPPDLKDVFVRAPWWAMFTRPRSIGWKNSRREDLDLKPSPPSTKRR